VTNENSKRHPVMAFPDVALELSKFNYTCTAFSVLHTMVL